MIAILVEHPVERRGWCKGSGDSRQRSAIGGEQGAKVVIVPPSGKCCWKTASIGRSKSEISEKGEGL